MKDLEKSAEEHGTHMTISDNRDMTIDKKHAVKDEEEGRGESDGGDGDEGMRLWMTRRMAETV